MKNSNQQLSYYLLLATVCTFLFLAISFSSCNDDKEPARALVYMQDTVFNPSVALIPAGGVVMWENDGVLVHTVTNDSGIFNSGNIAPDGTFEFTFEEPGTYEYHCMHHSSMTGTVIVE